MRDCRYGQPGDRLWVREPWRTTTDLDPYSGSQIATLCLEAGHKKPWAPIQYEADSHRVNWEHTSTPPHNGPPHPGRYRPAMFMPRWASRILLDVVSVRVERLKDISKADAMSEGIVEVFDGYGLQDGSFYDGTDPIESYAALWESINGAGSWDANPWVWVVQFRVLEPNTRHPGRGPQAGTPAAYDGIGGNPERSRLKASRGKS